MNEFVKFSINVNGTNREAIVLSQYSFNDEEYCIYAINDGENVYNVHYGRIINNTLVPDSIERSDLNYRIVSSIVRTVK